MSLLRLSLTHNLSLLPLLPLLSLLSVLSVLSFAPHPATGLCLLLPFVLRKTKVWSKCKLRIFVRKSSKITAEEQKVRVADLLHKVRISAHEINVVEIPETGNTDRADEHARMIENMKKEITEYEKETLLTGFDIEEESKGGGGGGSTGGKQEDGDLPTALDKTWEVAAKWLAAKTLLGNEIRERAGADTRLVVVAMPIPRSEVGPSVREKTSLSKLTHTLPRAITDALPSLDGAARRDVGGLVRSRALCSRDAGACLDDG